MLKLQHPGGGNGDSSGRFRPARSGNPNPTGWLLCHGACAREELSLWPTSRSRRTRGGRGLIPGLRKLSMSLRLRQPGRRDGDSPGVYRPAGYGKPNPTGWLLSLKELACKESRATGQRRRPSAPWEDRVSSPDKKSCYVCTIPKRPGTKAVISQVDTARTGVETSTPLAGC